MKQLRRGSQDYQYFWLMAQKADRQETDAAVRSIIHDFAGKEGAMGSPGMWNHNPEDWEKARIQLVERPAAR